MIKYFLRSAKDPQTKEAIFYAKEMPTTPVGIEQVCDEIVQKTALSRPDVKSAVAALEEVVIAHLSAGNSVRLGDLGSFRPTIRSSSVKDAKTWKDECIRSVGVNFTKGSRIRERFKLDRLRFLRVDKKASE